jgi:hypothetical protein
MVFWLGFLVGMLVGAFVFTAATVMEAERRAARKLDERIAARYRHPSRWQGSGSHRRV